MLGQRTRSALAWVFMLTVYAVCCAVTIIFGRLFGPSKLAAMVSSWGLALSQTFIVEEPLLIFISSVLPKLMEKLMANEWVANIVNTVISSAVGQAIASAAAAIRGG